jgi:hypothetical protein
VEMMKIKKGYSKSIEELDFLKKEYESTTFWNFFMREWAFKIFVIIFLLMFLGLIVLICISYHKKMDSLDEFQKNLENYTNERFNFCYALPNCDSFSCMAQTSLTFDESDYWRGIENNCLLKELQNES